MTMAKHRQNKEKTKGITCEGVVDEALPNAFFRVRLANDSIVLCHLGGKMRTRSIRVLPNDRVLIEISPYDLTRGRITYRYL